MNRLTLCLIFIICLPCFLSAQNDVIEVNATKDYYRGVQTVMIRLKDKKRHRKTMGQLAHACRLSANYIDRLPTLYVDEAMLDYGVSITDHLRGLATTVIDFNILKRPETLQAVYEAVNMDWQNSRWNVNYQTSFCNTNTNLSYYGFPSDNCFPTINVENYQRSWRRRRNHYGIDHWELNQQQFARTYVSAYIKSEQATAIQKSFDRIRRDTTDIRIWISRKYEVQF